jgi:hypothetical protein
MLEVNCPNCTAPIQVRAEYAGLHLQCPRCSAKVAVPPDAGTPEAPAPVSAVAYVEEGRPLPHGGPRTDIASAAIAEGTPAPRPAGAAPPQRRRSYRPCPRCGDAGAARVAWTPWGSFYGPALLSHVRCPECGHAYNGKTGRSNALWIVFFTLIPLVLLLGVNVALWLMIATRGEEWRWIVIGLYVLEGITALVLVVLALIRPGGHGAHTPRQRQGV